MLEDILDWTRNNVGIIAVTSVGASSILYFRYKIAQYINEIEKRDQEFLKAINKVIDNIPQEQKIKVHELLSSIREREDKMHYSVDYALYRLGTDIQGM